MVALQYLLPQHFLSRLVHAAARWSWKPWKNFLISSFACIYRVRMDEAEQPDLKQYGCFNDFFTRTLKADARPMAPEGKLASPVDGVVSEAGILERDRIIQAKGRYFSVVELLGEAADETRQFIDGRFATLYLAPSEYHRVHMPLAGTLEQMKYIPGALFSVSPKSTKGISRLFVRNERIVMRFTTDCGPMALCMIGALFVGSMETVWQGEVTPATRRVPEVFNYKGLTFARGEEIARFNMGSTVILLLGAGRVEWDDMLKPGTAVRMGCSLGSVPATLLHSQRPDTKRH